MHLNPLEAFVLDCFGYEQMSFEEGKELEASLPYELGLTLPENMEQLQIKNVAVVDFWEEKVYDFDHFYIAGPMRKFEHYYALGVIAQELSGLLGKLVLNPAGLVAGDWLDKSDMDSDAVEASLGVFYLLIDETFGAGTEVGHSLSQGTPTFIYPAKVEDFRIIHDPIKLGFIKDRHPRTIIRGNGAHILSGVEQVVKCYEQHPLPITKEVTCPACDSIVRRPSQEKISKARIPVMLDKAHEKLDEIKERV